MSTPDPPQLLAAASPVNNGTTFSIRLSWVNPVKYDKLQVAWGVGTLPTSPSPGSAEPDPASQSYTIAGFSPNTTVVLKVQGAVYGDPLAGQNPAELIWSGWAAINVVVPNSLNEVLLFYRPDEGVASTATITSGTLIGDITKIGVGGWEKDWTQLTSFFVGGMPFLLLYSQSGNNTFSAPVISGPNIGTPTKIHTVKQREVPLASEAAHDIVQMPGWSQITFFVVGGPFLLFYNQKTGDTFTAPIVSGTVVGPPTQIASVGTDWTLITSFVFGGSIVGGSIVGGSPFLLFYNQSSGMTFTAPIVTGSLIGNRTQIGRWDGTWNNAPCSQITSFVVGGSPFLLLYKQLDGSIWTAPIISDTQIGQVGQIKTTATDWALIGPLAT
jgi:hypothetical protein